VNRSALPSPIGKLRISVHVLTLGLVAAAITAIPGRTLAAKDDTQNIIVAGESIRIEFSPIDGRPLLWQACDPACDTQPPARVRKTTFFSSEDNDPLRGLMTISASGVGSMASGPLVSSTLHQDQESTIVEFRNRLPGVSGFLLQRYEIPHEGYTVRYHAETWGAAGGAATLAYRYSTGTEFAPLPMPGFSSGYAQVRPVIITDGRQADEGIAGSTQLEADDWAGMRSRFWALVTRNPAGGGATIDSGRNAVSLSNDGEQGLDLEFYSGPVDRDQLGPAHAGLASLLFAHVWAWLRPLCFGLMAIFGFLLSVLGNTGLAIMLLSVVVKILMYPLTRLAENWQAQVNRIHARLQPALERAKKGHKGEERHERVLAVYREQGVHPLYTMRSLFGYLVQIPVFIAAFAMLGENIALAETPWFWIDDLSRPDAFLALPGNVPFFGSDFNLLPVIMTALSVLAAMTHRDAHLTAPLLVIQKQRLYFLSLLFLVLFYTFPAGMVLYWTTNNLLHLVASRFRSGAA
jgi:YidC/Oxa1 family membrane protein insertase